MSQTELMNQALDLLEEEPILGPDDDRGAVRWMNRNYASVRDSMLRVHPWNFAIKRAKLAREDATPVSGWNYQFILPPDCLRVLPLNSGYLTGASIQFAVEGRRLLTNGTDNPIPIQYIARIEDTSLMDALFVQAFAASLAYRAGSWLTSKQGYAQLLQQQAKDLLLQAQMVDSLEGSSAEPEADDWVQGRVTGVVLT